MKLPTQPPQTDAEWQQLLQHLNQQLYFADAVNEQLFDEMNQPKQAAEQARNSEMLNHLSDKILLPLKDISSTFEHLSHASLSPTQRRYTETALHACQALVQLLQHIVDYAALSQQQLHIDAQVFDTAAWRLALNHQLLDRCLRKFCQLEFNTSEIQSEHVHVDNQRLTQICITLLEDLINHSQNSTINVRCLHNVDDPNYWQIDIHSATPYWGEKHTINNLHHFEPGKHSLAFYVTQGVVDAMGGHITVKHNSNENSTLSLTFPASMQ